MSSLRNTLEERDTPQAIRDAARACVLAVGVRRTTVTDVARRAGVSRMTVYRHVPDVTTLILQVATEDFGELVATARQRTARLRTGRERLVETVAYVVESLPRMPLFERILDVDPEILLPYLTDRLGATQRLAVAEVSRQLREAVADGSVRRCDVDVVAYSLVLTVTAHVLSTRITAVESEPSAVLRELRRQLDTWLAPAGARPLRSVPAGARP